MKLTRYNFIAKIETIQVLKEDPPFAHAVLAACEAENGRWVEYHKVIEYAQTKSMETLGFAIDTNDKNAKRLNTRIFELETLLRAATDDSVKSEDWVIDSIKDYWAKHAGD